MKRVICVALMVILLGTMLCGCGEEKFTCGLCMKQVTQKPHAVTVLGQKVKICDSCYGTIGNLRGQMG